MGSQLHALARWVCVCHTRDVIVFHGLRGRLYLDLAGVVLQRNVSVLYICVRGLFFRSSRAGVSKKGCKIEQEDALLS